MKAVHSKKLIHRNFLLGNMLAVAFLVSFLGIRSAHAAIQRQLDVGSTGADVIELQTYLAANAGTYPPNRITGNFDLLTQSAVQRFQSTQGIVSSGTPKTSGYGRVGPRTAQKLNALMRSASGVSVITTSTPFTNTAVVPLMRERSGFGLPARIRIPTINVNAPVQRLGLTPQGAMEAPKGPTDVAWFNLGPRPGEQGSAVIAGHYGPWKNGQGSVFDNLNTLAKGDRVYIEDGNGTTTAFVVVNIRTYDKSQDPSDVFGSSDGRAHLNLVTCEGIWNAAQKTYSNRLVIFTDKATE